MSRSGFKRALTEARLNKKPVIALRANHRDPKLMDDVAIESPRTVHIEMMGDDALWIGVDLVNRDRICFNVFARKRGCLEFAVCEYPEDDYLDWDEVYRSAQERTSGR